MSKDCTCQTRNASGLCALEVPVPSPPTNDQVDAITEAYWIPLKIGTTTIRGKFHYLPHLPSDILRRYPFTMNLKGGYRFGQVYRGRLRNGGHDERRQRGRILWCLGLFTFLKERVEVKWHSVARIVDQK
jgi:hypothetical protein